MTAVVGFCEKCKERNKIINKNGWCRKCVDVMSKHWEEMVFGNVPKEDDDQVDPFIEDLMMPGSIEYDFWDDPVTPECVSQVGNYTGVLVPQLFEDFYTFDIKPEVKKVLDEENRLYQKLSSRWLTSTT